MSKQILMSFLKAPMDEDISIISHDVLANMPDELAEHIEDLVLQIEDLPDETTEADLELNDPYELLALYKPANELAPGVEKKHSDENDVLVLYRRPILDSWCESGEELIPLIRETMIEEIATQFEFSESDIEEMVRAEF